MPFYDYKCKDCKNKFEAFHAMTDSSTVCPKCGGKCQKIIKAPGVIYRGSGFYCTDNK